MGEVDTRLIDWIHVWWSGYMFDWVEKCGLSGDMFDWHIHIWSSGYMIVRLPGHVWPSGYMFNQLYTCLSFDEVERRALTPPTCMIANICVLLLLLSIQSTLVYIQCIKETFKIRICIIIRNYLYSASTKL